MSRNSAASRTSIELDVHAPGARDSADQIWAQMREAEGLAHVPAYGGYHAVARFEDVMKALTTPDVFASGHGITVPPPTGIRSPHIPAEVDPPEHRHYRALLMPFLTPQAVRQREPAVREIVRGLLDKIGDQTHFDFVEHFARPLPVLATASLLGLPSSDAAYLDALVVELHDEVAKGQRTGAAQKLTGYVEKILVARKETATDADDDLLSSIVLGTVSGRPLTLDEQVSMVRLFLVGGFDTTAIAMATLIWWLAQHPDDAQRLRDDASLMDPMIEDAVRFSSPSTYLRRQVVKDTELGGTALKVGDQVLIAFGAANRDPSRFENPDEIRTDRKPNPHLGFGAGNHRCVGSFFAKLEMRVALEEIFARYSSLRLDPERPIQTASGLNQGISFLPIVAEYRDRAGQS